VNIQIIQGDALDVLRTLPDQSVQCCVTSPPYWGLRDYGVDGQMGLEPTPEEYVAKMVEVFREVRRVLRDDGVLWLNMGDSYAGGGRGGNPEESSYRKQATNAGSLVDPSPVPVGLKPKDLIGIPWRVAFALRADGWYLRSDIIWAKPNPMPESVTDRPTKAHEYVFLLAKGQWVSRVVPFANLPRERVHLGKYFGLQRPDFGANEVCVLFATALFDRAQHQQGFGLPPFYAQEWKQGADGYDSDLVRSLPPDYIAAVGAARFLDGDTTAEQFLCEMDRLRIALRDSGNLLVGRVSPERSDAPAFDCDGEGTITIHHTGKISKIEFSHKRIIVSAPTTCKYYYDADAIAEPCESGESDVKKMIEARDRIGGKALLDDQPLHAANANTNIGKKRAVGGKASGNKARKLGEDRGRPGSHIAGSIPWPAGVLTRNARTVWTIAPHGCREAHFATMPPELARRCILAGTKPGDVVLDPFAGAGTTLLVADRNNRDGIGVELNPKYVEMARRRINDDAPLLVTQKQEDGDEANTVAEN